MSKGAKLALVIAGVVVALGLIGLAVWAWGGWRGYGGWGMMGRGGMMGGFGVMWLLVPCAIGVAVLFSIGLGGFGHGWGLHAHGEHKPDEGPETALEILKRRYANGEIDRAEFEQKKSDLV